MCQHAHATALARVWGGVKAAHLYLLSFFMLCACSGACRCGFCSAVICTAAGCLLYGCVCHSPPKGHCWLALAQRCNMRAQVQLGRACARDEIWSHIAELECLITIGSTLALMTDGLPEDVLGVGYAKEKTYRLRRAQVDTWAACVPSAVCRSICFPSRRSVEGRLFVESRSLGKQKNISELVPEHTIGLGFHRICH